MLHFEELLKTVAPFFVGFNHTSRFIFNRENLIISCEIFSIRPHLFGKKRVFNPILQPIVAILSQMKRDIYLCFGWIHIWFRYCRHYLLFDSTLHFVIRYH